MSYLEEHRSEILKKHDTDIMLNDVANYRKGTGKLYKVLNTFFEEEMYKCKGGRGEKTPMQILQSDEDVQKALEYIKTKPKFYVGTETSNLKSYLRNNGTVCQKVANFPIKEVTEIYNKYSKFGDTIYDPCCGFGSRMSACLLNGRDYVGTDPNQSLMDKLRECEKFYRDNNLINGNKCRLIGYGSELHIRDLDGMVDLIFTSPPYFDLELYGDDEGQSTVKFPTYPEWLEGYVKPTIDNCMKYLKTDGIIAINIKNMTSGKKHKLFDDWSRIIEETGWAERLDDISIKQSSKRDFKGKHGSGATGDMGETEGVMVFKKKATQIFSLGIPENEPIEQFEKDMDQLTKQSMKDIYEPNQVINDEAQDYSKPKKGGILEERFGVPPFSILDAKQKYWQDRKREWIAIGLESEVGRDARSFNTKEWFEEKGMGAIASTDVSIFDPVLCELSYKWFCKPRGKILDPFAGGSVRGIVASTFGYDYTGVDLRKEQVDANYTNIPKLSIKLPIEPNWICGDSLNIKSIGGEYDMVFSCPPYHDLEEYSKDSKDLSNMSYTEFIKTYREIIKGAVSMLKNNSFAVFVVGEIRDKDGFYKNFVADTISAFLDAGMKYYNDMILFTVIGSLPVRVSKQFEPYRKIGKLHQNILVFYKGDPKMIKPMDMTQNAFRPLNELNIAPIIRDQNVTELAEVAREKSEEERLTCELCGFKAGDQKSFDSHIPRPFHQGYT